MLSVGANYVKKRVVFLVVIFYCFCVNEVGGGRQQRVPTVKGTMNNLKIQILRSFIAETFLEFAVVGYKIIDL